MSKFEETNENITDASTDTVNFHKVISECVVSGSEMRNVINTLNVSTKICDKSDDLPSARCISKALATELRMQLYEIPETDETDTVVSAIDENGNGNMTALEKFENTNDRNNNDNDNQHSDGNGDDDNGNDDDSLCSDDKTLVNSSDATSVPSLTTIIKNLCVPTSHRRGRFYDMYVCSILSLHGYKQHLHDFELQIAKSQDPYDITFYTGTKYKLYKLTQSNQYPDMNSQQNLAMYLKSIIDFGMECDFIVLIRTNTLSQFNVDINNMIRCNVLVCADVHDGIFTFPFSRYYRYADSMYLAKFLKADKTSGKILSKYSCGVVEKAIQSVIYALHQPDEYKLHTLMHNAIETSAPKPDNTQYLVDKLKIRMLNWCDRQIPLNITNYKYLDDSNTQHIITYDDVDLFFQENVKTDTDNFAFSTSTRENVPFVGRRNDIERIHKLLTRFAPSLVVKGLSGIGKTALVHQYLVKYRAHYYGRIVWIDASSRKTFIDSLLMTNGAIFTSGKQTWYDQVLASSIATADAQNDAVRLLIHKIFTYFTGLKVIFVFDNYNPYGCCDGVGTFMHYVNDMMCTVPVKHHMPFVIYTTQQRDCFPEICCLELTKLTDDETSELLHLHKFPYLNVDRMVILQMIQGIPLVACEVMRYLNNTTETYVHPLKLLSITMHDHYESFGSRWDNTIDLVTRTFRPLERTVMIEMLKILSYLKPTSIAIDIFKKKFDRVPSLLNDIFNMLERYHWLDKNPTKPDTYMMHASVQLFLQCKYYEDKTETIYETLDMLQDNEHPMSLWLSKMKTSTL